MSQHIIRPQGPSPDGQPNGRHLPEGDGGLRAPPGLGPWGKFWWWLKFWLFVKTARLRFIAVLVAVGGVIAYWDTLQAMYEKWTRPAPEHAAAASGFEFWCPMHPTVIRDHPDKCPVCGMPLSRRKKGEAGEEEPLPPGVVSRVQLSPYRVALAGIQTAKVEYRPLTKEIRAVGFVEFDERKLARISARVTGKSRIEKLFVNVTGQHVNKGDPLAVLYSPDLVVTVRNLLDAQSAGNQDLVRAARERLRLWGLEDDQIAALVKNGQPVRQVTLRAPISGHVIKKYQAEGEYVEEGARLFDLADLSTVWVEAQVYEDDLAFLKEGLTVTATTKAFPGRAFRGELAFVQPHLDTATRTVRVRFDVDNRKHELRPGMYAAVKLQVPTARLDLFATTLREDWAATLAADGAAQALAAPVAPSTGASLLWAAPRYTLRQRGLVPAVPESSVIDTGTRKVVYRVAEPGVYDGVEVQLGPRSGAFYPVVRGLEAGDEVATAGSFLIDAETRLNPAAGASYFGASGGPQEGKRGGAVRPSMGDDTDAKVKASLARLRPADRALAEQQEFCAVLENSRLGSMGVPIKLLVQGRPVFVCCKGCVKEARANAEKTLRRLDERKSGKQAKQAPEDRRAREEAEIRAALAKLSPEDRRLAEEQVFCASQKENSRLGSMGVPLKLMILGQPVFVCCEGCEQEARDHPAQALATVERLRAKAKAAPPGR
jgi:Cu(I)/Ag(I) efflux system membrane fusion protein